MNQSCRVRRSRSEWRSLSTVYQKTWPTPVASGPSVGTAPSGSCVETRLSRSRTRRPREVLIHVVFEDDVDHREAERGLRADDAHAGQALQVHRERVADLVFDFLRAVAGPVGEHDDLVVGEIGNRVDRRGGGGPPAPRSERHRERDDEDAVLQRQFDNPVHHGFSGVNDFLRNWWYRGAALEVRRIGPRCVSA